MIASSLLIIPSFGSLFWVVILGKLCDKAKEGLCRRVHNQWQTKSMCAVWDAIDH